MHQGFWHKCWEKQAIGFHQDDVHPFLTGELAQLPINISDNVFVPLCGKSLDMLWWAERCNVIGSELSEIACRDFFKEQGVTVDISEITTDSSLEQGIFTLFQKDNLTIYQGDFFALTASDLPPIRYIFDRAALVALPQAMQTRYAKHLASYIAADTECYLISVEFPQDEHQGPPFSTDKQTVQSLFTGLNVEEIVSRTLEDKQFAKRSLAVSYLVERLYRITR